MCIYQQNNAKSQHPFGMLIKERSYFSDSYRFGFNGMEKDDEVVGDGSCIEFKFRIYDSRLGRFFSVDPLSMNYPWNSPYAFAENNPIRFIDLEGLEKANPEMFTLALKLIDHYRDISHSGVESKVKGVDMCTVLDQLEKQVNSASTNGYSDAKTNYMGYYCGKSAAHNDLIIYNPMGYVSFIFDLFSKGEAQFGDDGLNVSLPEDLKTIGPTESVPAVDEVFGKSVNSSTTNKSIVRNTINILSNELSEEGNTIPFEYNRILKAVGMKVQYSSYYSNYKKADLERISKAISAGFIPIVFENHGVTTSSPDGGNSGKYGIHFISIHSLTITGDQVDFTFWHYGKLESGSKTVEEFTDGMKGYWIPENE